MNQEWIDHALKEQAQMKEELLEWVRRLVDEPPSSCPHLFGAARMAVDRYENATRNVWFQKARAHDAAVPLTVAGVVDAAVRNAKSRAYTEALVAEHFRRFPRFAQQSAA